MKTTEDCLKYLSTHPWLKKQYGKLKSADIEVITSFLSVSYNTREDAFTGLTKFFIASPASKNKLVIDELLSCAISFRFN